MRTARSSSHRGGVSTRHPPDQAPPRIRHPEPGTPKSRNPPRDEAPHPGSGTPPGPGRSPSTSPLGVGLDQIPLHFAFGCGPGDPPLRPAVRHAGIPPAMLDGIAPPRPAARHAGIPPAMHTVIAPPPVDRHTPVNILPCPKLRLRAVKIVFCIVTVEQKILT